MPMDLTLEHDIVDPARWDANQGIQPTARSAPLQKLLQAGPALSPTVPAMAGSDDRVWRVGLAVVGLCVVQHKPHT